MFPDFSFVVSQDRNNLRKVKTVAFLTCLKSDRIGEQLRMKNQSNVSMFSHQVWDFYMVQLERVFKGYLT